MLLHTFSCDFKAYNLFHIARYVIFKENVLMLERYNIMQVTRYIFDSINRANNSNYIFQHIEKRKLSDIYHSHDFYECIIILNGSCIQQINDTEVLAEPGTCILLSPSDLHCFIQQSPDIRLLCLSVRADEFQRVENIFESHFSKSGIFCIPLHSSDFRYFLGSATSNTENDYKILLAHFIKVLSDKPPKTSTIPNALQFAIKEMHLTHNLCCGLNKFSELSGYSKSQLNRLMKKYYHTTSHEYLLNMRLDTAYKELIYTAKSMEEIAEELGYSSFSHFNKIFKDKYNITPATLRKTHGVRTI